MSRGPSGDGAGPSGFPRVSGDEPVLLAVVAVVVSFSPRERG